MKEKRLDYIDMVKGIGIVLVVIGHSTYVSEPVLTWLTSFHMPLFFVVSGMLFAHKDSAAEPFGSYVRKRFCGMMIPYFWFSLIYLGVDYYYLYAHPQVIDQAFINSAWLQALSFFGISVLWFLPTIFVGEVSLYGLIRKCPPGITALLCVAGIFIPTTGMNLIRAYIDMEASFFYTWLGNLLMALLRVFPAVIFLLMGYYTYFQIRKLYLRPYLEVLVGIGCLLLNGAVAFANGRVDMHYLVFHHVLLYYLGAYSASLGLLLLCRHIRPFWLPCFLGTHSLIVMLTHLDCQVMSLAIRFAAGMNQFIPRAKDLLFRVNLYGALLIGELFMIVLVGKIGFFLIGRKRPLPLEGPGWLQQWWHKMRSKKMRRVK